MSSIRDLQLRFFVEKVLTKNIWFSLENLSTSEPYKIFLLLTQFSKTIYPNKVIVAVVILHTFILNENHNIYHY